MRKRLPSIIGGWLRTRASEINLFRSGVEIFIPNPSWSAIISFKILSILRPSCAESKNGDVIEERKVGADILYIVLHTNTLYKVPLVN